MPGTLVVLSARLGPVLPAAALTALRAAEQVYADATVPAALAAELGATVAAEPPTPASGLVLFTLDDDHPDRRHWDVVSTPEPAGVALLDAVAVMDRLRSPGGCPWDAEQTHTSLLQYLVEECYELYQAIEDADRPALREELGDVLLQVLFHARLAAEGGAKPFAPGSEGFTVDDVARDLVAKLIGRHPHVFGAGERVDSASDQELRWDELKRVEKRRESALDGVALGQPAVALVAKLVSRAGKAGLPDALVYRAATEGDRALFEAVVAAKLAGRDPEQQLRDAARSFDRTVRAAERNARAAGLDPHRLDADQWTASWPT